jgi:uncharacterized membrane protein HdeD (DUF308 family)
MPDGNAPVGDGDHLPQSHVTAHATLLHALAPGTYWFTIVGTPFMPHAVPVVRGAIRTEPRWFMDNVLVRNWGLVALRGVVALLFGLLTLFNPGITLVTLVLLFGAYAFVDGIFTIIGAIANRHEEPHWVALLLAGLVGIIAGIVTFLLPGITARALLLLIAAWAIVVGISEIVAAIRLRKLITGEWLLVLAGLLAVAFGVLVILAPGVGALAVVLWIGAYALVSGVVLLALAFRLRRWAKAEDVGARASAV